MLPSAVSLATKSPSGIQAAISVSKAHSPTPAVLLGLFFTLFLAVPKTCTLFLRCPHICKIFLYLLYWTCVHCVKQSTCLLRGALCYLWAQGVFSFSTITCSITFFVCCTKCIEMCTLF